MPPGYPAYDYTGQPTPNNGTNGFAVASFILGLLGLFMVSIILSVVFGIVALTQIRNRPQRGKGLAIAGLALSGAWVLILAGLIAIGIANQPPRPTSTGQITGQGNVEIISLRVGDCFQNSSASDALLGVTYVTAVPCTTPQALQCGLKQVLGVRAPAGERDRDAHEPIATLRRQSLKLVGTRVTSLVAPHNAPSSDVSSHACPGIASQRRGTIAEGFLRESEGGPRGAGWQCSAR